MGVAQKAIKSQINPVANELASLIETVTAMGAVITELVGKVAALQDRAAMTEADWMVLAKAATLVADFEAMAGDQVVVDPAAPAAATTPAGGSVTGPEIL